MDTAEIVIELSSNSLRAVLDALVSLSDMVSSGQIHEDIVESVFVAIVPLLAHNHYKIRHYSFLILSGLFRDHFHSISNSLEALPSILLSLLSVNQQVKTSAYECLKIILENYDVREFWFDIENIICKSRSLDERVRVLELLRDIATRIPLSPIIKLVDDPMYQIRRAALSVLEQADEESVKQAIRETRISYDAMKLLISRLPYLGNVWEYLDVAVSTSPLPGSRGKRRTPQTSIKGRHTGQSKSLSRTPHGAHGSERVVHGKGVSMAEFSSGFAAGSHGFGFSVGGGGGGGGFGRSFTPRARTKRGQTSGGVLAKSFGPENESGKRMGPVRDLSRRGIERRNGNSSGYYGEFGELQRVDDVDLARMKALASPKRRNERRLGRSGRVELGAKKVFVDPDELLKPDPDEYSEEEEQLNILGNVEIIDNGDAFKVRDMSQATWMERQAFLTLMRDTIETGGKISSTPEEMLDCVMSISKPAHKKVVVMIPPVIAALLLRNPEIVTTRLREIIEFTLYYMVGDDWRQDIEFENYLSVLTDTADPVEIVSLAVNVQAATERPLPCELLIMFVYEKRNNLMLPYSVVSHLVAWLIGTQNRSDSQEELLRFICKREVNHVIQFGTGQSAGVRKSLLPYVKGHVPAKKQEGSSTRPKDPEIRTTDPEKLLGIMMEESMKGKKCDLPKLLVAFGLFSGELPYNVYIAFLDALGKLPEAVVDQNEKTLRRLCVSTFDRPSFLRFFFDDWVPPERVIGFSRIVWNSSSELLSGSEKLLPILYRIFLESTGPVRLDICRIFLAIEHATSHSILELRELKEPYRKLITSMMSQFRVEKA